MAQGPLAAAVAVKGGAYAPLQLDKTSNLLVGKGSSSALGVSASTVIKTGVGRIAKINVTTAGAVGAIHDSLTVAGISAATLIAVVPAVVGFYDADFPFTAGLVYVPGAAQVASISYT